MQRLEIETVMYESRPWHLYASAAWVVFFTVWFALTTLSLLDQEEDLASADLATWAALVVIQAMIWGVVAYINLGIHNTLETHQVSPLGAAFFVVVTFIAVSLPIAITALVGVEILGSAQSGFVGAIIQVVGFVSVVPAVLVIYYSRSNTIVGEWDTTVDSVRRLRHLRRSVRAATTSLGVVIAVAIVAVAFVREAMAERSGTFNVESVHIVLYGGFFTAFVFALYFYGKSGVDRRARWLVDMSVPGVDLSPAKRFFDNEELRRKMATELGLGVTAREGFENLVIVASPMLSAILTTFIST